MYKNNATLNCNFMLSTKKYASKIVKNCENLEVDERSQDFKKTNYRLYFTQYFMKKKSNLHNVHNLEINEVSQDFIKKL